MKATIDNIKTIIETAGVFSDIDDLKFDVPLTDQGLDSLDLVNIYLLIEEKFGLKIPDEDLVNVQTIEKIIEYVNLKKS